MWKNINENYLVSDKGEVFSVRADRKLSPVKMKIGYCYVTLNLDGTRKKYYVHRLVAKAFIPNPNNLPVINHKDENGFNNNVSNLEWCDKSYNAKYGTCPERRRQKAKKTAVLQKKDGQLVGSYESISSASRITGITKGNIYNSISNAVKAGGYNWYAA